MNRHLKTLALFLGVVVVFFYGGKLGLSLAFVSPYATPIWPPTGIALAALMVGGYRLAPAIFIGSFLVNFTTQSLLITTLGIATGDTLEALVAAVLVRKFAKGVKCFDGVRTTVKFILLAAIFSTLITATFGVVSLGLASGGDWQYCRLVWLTWWFGDMTSNLLIAPLLIIWLTRRLPRWHGGQLLERAVWFLTLAGLGWLVFLRQSAFAAVDQIEYLIVPPLLWAAFRFGLHGAITSAFAISGLALWGTLNQSGPFSTSNPNESLLLVQAFTAVICVTVLMVRAVIAERQRLHYSLVVKNAVSQILARDRGLTEAIPEILQVLCERCKWELVALWQVDATAVKLFCSEVWRGDRESYVEFETLTRKNTFALGRGLPGRVWFTGQPAWVPVVAREDDSERAPAAERAGLGGAFGFPLKSGSQTLGVLECYVRDRHAPDEDFVLLLRSVGDQLGLFIERERLARDLHASEVRYRTLFEQAHEAIWILESAGERAGQILLANPAAAGMHGYTIAEMLRLRITDLDVPDSVARAPERFEQIKRGEWISGETLHVHKDGSQFPIEFSAGPIQFDGRPCVLAFSRDISERQRAAATLRASELRFKQVAESIPEVFWITNLEKTEVVYISPAYETIWGRTCASLYASPQNWVAAIHPEDRDRVLGGILARQVAGEYDEEYRILRPDGAVRWIRDRAFPILDERGAVCRLAGIAEDVTLRWQAEFQLALLGHSVESSAEFICITDLEDRFIFTNRAFCQAYGYRKDELIGKTPALIYSPRNPSGLLPEIMKQSRAGGWSGEVWDRRKDGTELLIHLRTSPVRDHAGVVIALMAVAVNITEARWSELALLELAAIVQGSEDGIVSISLEDLVTSWNRGATQIFGYTVEEMIGVKISTIFPPAEYEKARQVIARVKRGESVEPYEAARLHKDGTVRIVSVKVSPVTNADGITISLSAIYRDITSQKQLEKAILEISANERRRLGHDLHDGLGQHLAGAAFKAKALEEALAAKSLPEATTASLLLDIINEGIRQTRDLAQGLDPVDVEVAGLPAALQKLAGQTTRLFDLACDFHSNQEHWSGSSPIGLALYRIAQEGIHNAIVHGKARHIRIDLEIDPARVRLKIKDDGQGFRVEEKPAAGMGLRIMRYRASSVGGDVTVHSRMNAGTEVVCIVPEKTALP